jgi:hypothetical protein
MATNSSESSTMISPPHCTEVDRAIEPPGPGEQPPPKIDEIHPPQQKIQTVNHLTGEHSSDKGGNKQKQQTLRESLRANNAKKERPTKSSQRNTNTHTSNNTDPTDTPNPPPPHDTRNTTRNTNPSKPWQMETKKSNLQTRRTSTETVMNNPRTPTPRKQPNAQAEKKSRYLTTTVITTAKRR